jgi:phage regulator Rha-like protein
VLTGFDLAQESQRGSHADHSVAAHAQVAGIVEEDHTGIARRIEWLHKQSSNQNVRPARFAQNRTPVYVVVAAKAFKALGKRPGSQVGSA